MSSAWFIHFLFDNILYIFIAIFIVILFCVVSSIRNNKDEPPNEEITYFGYFKIRLPEEWKKEDWVETKIQSNLNNGKMIKLENKNGPEFTEKIEIGRRQKWGTSSYGEAEVTYEEVHGKYCLTMYYIPYSNYHECKNSEKRVKDYINNEHGSSYSFKRYTKTIIVIIKYNDAYSFSRGETLTVTEGFSPVYRGGIPVIIEEDNL